MDAIERTFNAISQPTTADKLVWELDRAAAALNDIASAFAELNENLAELDQCFCDLNDDLDPENDRE